MNRRILKIVLWILFGLFWVVFVFLALVVKVDYAADIPVDRMTNQANTFDLYPQLKNIDLANFKETFPYETYIKQANWRSINAINQDLMAMDSVNRDNEMMNQEVLSIALTEKLESQIKPAFEQYNPDSLIRLLQWAEKFNAFSQIDETHAVLYEVIYNYWMNFISNSIRDSYEKSYTIKYNYKFRYIADRLREQQFSTPIRGTYLEKTISKLIEKNWTYLFNKFWHATSVTYKMVVLFFVILIFFPYFYIFIGFKKKLK